MGMTACGFRRDKGALRRGFAEYVVDAATTSANFHQLRDAITADEVIE